MRIWVLAGMVALILALRIGGEEGADKGKGSPPKDNPAPPPPQVPAPPPVSNNRPPPPRPPPMTREQLFKLLDTNGDGVISKEEFMNARIPFPPPPLPPPTADEVFKHLDANGD